MQELKKSPSERLDERLCIVENGENGILEARSGLYLTKLQGGQN